MMSRRKALAAFGAALAAGALPAAASRSSIPRAATLG
jgi:hypothetical protein